jgi:hypothetical protein
MVAVTYRGGVPTGLQSSRNVSKNVKIILNVCYILMMIYAYLEIILYKKKKSEK